MKKLKFFAQKKSKWIFICYLFLLLILFSGLVTVCYFDIENHIDSPNIIILIILIFILAVPSLFVTSKTLFDLCIGAIFFRKETKLVLSKSMPKLVTVAIVIPTFNDFMEREIKKCFYQEYDKNKYVVKKYILDDSTDEEQIKQIDDFAKFNNVIVLRQTAENKKKYGSSCGLAAAFNYFIEQTKGKWDFMIHVDSGDFISADYIQKIIPHFFTDENLGIVAGRYVPFNRNYFFQNIIKYFDNDLSLMYFGLSKYQNMIMPGTGMVYSKEAIYSVGEWPNQMCEDAGISSEIIQNGFCTKWITDTYCAQLSVYNAVDCKKRWYRIFFGTFDFFKIKTDHVDFATKIYIFWLKITFFYTIPTFFLNLIIVQIFIPVFSISISELPFYIWIYSIVFTVLLVFIFFIFVCVHLNFKNIFSKENSLYIFMNFVSAIFLPPIILCALVLAQFNRLILKKKIPFIVTQKTKNISKNKIIIKHIWFNAFILLVGILVLTIILLSLIYTNNFNSRIFYILLPYSLIFFWFPISFIVMHLFSLIKTKYDFDSMKDFDHVSILA